ncbi:MAG TPA: AAA family ATPase [Actinomycetota bacterium]
MHAGVRSLSWLGSDASFRRFVVSSDRSRRRRDQSQAVDVPLEEGRDEALGRGPRRPRRPGRGTDHRDREPEGGVGKSTTAVSLGAALSELGYRVLVVDLDPQGNASTGLGIRHEARDVTVYDVIVSEAPLDDAVIPTPLEGLFALPSTIDLAGAEIELVSQFSREARLKKALQPVREGAYDFILLDCPPSLGLLTINALTAAEELIVPIQCEYYALEGLGQLLRNVNLVQQNINPGLRVTGIVLTMFDPRTKLSEQVVEEVRRFFGDLVYDVIIPRTVRLSEAPGFGQPITVYDPRSKGAESYRELAREVAVRPPPTEPLPSYDELPTVVVPPVDAAASAGPAPEEEALAELPVDAEERPVPTVHEIERHHSEGAEPSVDGEPPAEPEPRAEPEAAAVGDVQASALEAAPPADVVAERPPPAPPSAAEAPADGPAPVPAPPPVGDDEAVERARRAGDEIWEDAERVPPPKVRPVRRPSSDAPREPQAPEGRAERERRVVVIDEAAEDELTTGEPQAPASGTPAEPAGDASAAIGATLDDEPVGKRRWWQWFRKGGE